MVNYENAETKLNSAGINIHDDFFTLNSSQIEALLELAKIQGYRKSKNAPGSTARMYFYALQRKANASKQ